VRRSMRRATHWTVQYLAVLVPTVTALRRTVAERKRLLRVLFEFKLLRALIMTFLRGVTYLSAHASVKCAHCWHGIGIAICSAKLWV
jgi:hypothetical protein